MTKVSKVCCDRGMAEVWPLQEVSQVCRDRGVAPSGYVFAAAPSGRVPCVW